MAFDKFDDREKGAARDYVIPTGQNAVKNFKKKVVTELWPQLDVWCQYRTREIRENTTFDKNVPDADDEIPLDEFEHLAIDQWLMYQSKVDYAKMQKHKKTKLQRDMRKTERGLGAMPLAFQALLQVALVSHLGLQLMEKTMMRKMRVMTVIVRKTRKVMMVLPQIRRAPCLVGRRGKGSESGKDKKTLQLEMQTSLLPLCVEFPLASI
jgi:hypothetical protein